jgi:hypothetical protein
MRRLPALLAVLLMFPLGAAAGSQTYATPGTYSFTVPAHNTLTVTVKGAGGGGAGGSIGPVPSEDGHWETGGTGTNGGASSFGAVVGNGGKGGGGVASEVYGWYQVLKDGANGTGSGGDSNTTGGGASGGTAGSSFRLTGESYGSFTTPGGSGGSGGKAVKTYTNNDILPIIVTVVVGSRGTGGSGGRLQYEYGEGGTPSASAGSNGQNGSVSITWTDPSPASCSVSLTPSAINRGSSATLSWSATNADTSVYIDNVGYVSGSSGSFSVAPNTTTNYRCYAVGSGGTDGWHNATLTVYQPCSWNGGSIANGSAVTAYQSSSVSYGNSCISQTRTCTNGTLSGSYAYPSCSVAAAADCTLDGVTIPHGTSRTFYSQQTSPVGNVCSSVAQTRTCTNGTLSGSASYRYASCTCAPIYSCSGENVTYTNSSCSTTTVASCIAPLFCSPGVSACVSPDPDFQEGTSTADPDAPPGSGGSAGIALSGHLQIQPILVPLGVPTHIYWNVSNVESCSVLGDNGDSWSTLSSGSSGKLSSGIVQRTVFTLHCFALEGATPASFDEQQTVNILPIFQEL